MSAKKPVAPVWLGAAMKEIGETEVPGPKSNERILEYRKMAHVPLDGEDGLVPWCAIFTNAMFESVGIPGTRSGMARSPVTSKHFVKIAMPRLGCLVVFSRPPSKWSGHIGFVTGWSNTKLSVLGGNQGDMVKESQFPMRRVVGYYWPKSVPVPVYRPVYLGQAESTNGNEA